MSSPKSLTKKNQSFCGIMGDVLAKETGQVESLIEEDSWDMREDADGASSVEDSILRDIQEKLKLTRVSDDNYEDDDWPDDSITQCDCDACQEPIMSIRNPHFDRVQEHWQKLRMFIQIVYKMAAAGKTLDVDYHNQIQSIIHELVTLEPHLLYKQLEAQIQEWVIETELRQLENLLEADNVDDIPHLFISGLLESYKNLMAGAELAFPILEELQRVHLSKFNMTWNLLNEHIYQSSVYADPLVQNNVPVFIARLSSTSETMESNKDLVKDFLYLDDNINSVAELWIDCEQRLECYAKQQAEIEGKRTLLELQWKSYKEEGKTSLINKTLKKIVTSDKKCIPNNTEDFSSCSSDTFPKDSCDCNMPHLKDQLKTHLRAHLSHLKNDTKHPQPESGDALHHHPESNDIKRLLNGKSICSEHVNKSDIVKDVNRKNSISSETSAMISDCIDERSTSSSSRPPTPPQISSNSSHGVAVTSHPPHAHNHDHKQPNTSGKANISQQLILAKAHELANKKRRKPQGCYKVRQTCAHHAHPHAHKHSEPIKRVSGCEQHRFHQDNEDSDAASMADDSSSDKSSTSSHRHAREGGRHCDCCYCENGAPVSRNYQEIRERLRLLLKQKRSENKKNAVENNPTPSSSLNNNPINNNINTKSGGELLNKLPPPQKEQYFGDQCISDILDYIEGNTKIKDMKKAAKKARQKEKKLKEMYQKKLEEEAAERAKLEAEKRRKEELLREKERLILEQKRLERELQIQNQKLKNNNRKALSVKSNNNENITNNSNSKKKKNKQQSSQQQSQHTYHSQVTSNESSSANNKKKQKKKNKNGHVDDNDDVIVETQPVEDAPKMVTIKRVMESVGNEPTVTITLRGATPSEDKVLYTLQNGHVCPIEERNRNAANKSSSNVSSNTSSKKSKKQQKKLNQQQQQAMQQQSQESHPPLRPSTATHVQHSPGVVEINVNGNPIKPLGGSNKSIKASMTATTVVQNNTKKSKSGSDLPAGFSSMSVINIKQPTPSVPVKKPVISTIPIPAPQLTTSTAIQISNAISHLTAAKQGFNIEELRLPPGITITKVESPHNKVEDHSTSSPSCDGGDSDNINKENASFDVNAQIPTTKKSKKKKKKKQNQQQEQPIASSSDLIPNHNSSIQAVSSHLPTTSPAIIKVKGSMVTIRNPAAFPNEINTNTQQQYVNVTKSVAPSASNKKSRSKDSRSDEWNLVDEESVFAPKDIDLENGDIDDAERELEAFKRFCSQSVPPKQKEKVHLNIKDIVLKKKRAAISCN